MVLHPAFVVKQRKGKSSTRVVFSDIFLSSKMEEKQERRQAMTYTITPEKIHLFLQLLREESAVPHH